MRNLKLAIPLSFISMLFFPTATWMFFFLKHLDFQQIATIMGIGAIASLILEVPTGVFADIVGRKWAVALSYLMFTAAMIGTAYATTYNEFLIWTLVNATVNALYSGSMEALVYDTLKERREEDSYDRWTSRMEAVTWLGLFASAITGGYLYSMNPRYPYFLQAIVTGFAFLLALLLREPRLDTTHYKISDMFTKNLTGIRELFHSKRMRNFTMIFVVIGLGYYIAADILGISQARQYGLNTQAVGWIFGIGYILSAATSHYYPLLRKRWNESYLVWLSAAALIASFILAKFVGLAAGIGLITLRIASSTTFRNSRSVIINREISSSNRATTLSTLNLLTEFPYAIFASFIGAYIDRTSPNQFAFWLGTGLAAAIVLILISQMSHKYSEADHRNK